MFGKDAMANSEDAFGKGKVCPRDGEPDCSIVDAFWHQGNGAGPATQFLSWAWGYRVRFIWTSVPLDKCVPQLGLNVATVLGADFHIWVEGLVGECRPKRIGLLLDLLLLVLASGALPFDQLDLVPVQQ